MDVPANGPQASTRHARDRRPAYHTKAARSVAALEQRLEQRIAQLEGKHAASPQASRSATAVDIDADFNNFGQMFNRLEERVADVEKEVEGEEGIEARLNATIEERMKPYYEYQQEAGHAIQTLKGFQKRMRSASTSSKADDATSKLVSEHEASLRKFSSRMLRLEDQAELVKAQSLSTSDLGKALVHRLQRGDMLNPPLSQALRTALDVRSVLGETLGGIATQDMITAVPPERMPETPATDEARAESGAAEDSIEDQEDEAPKKRRRIRQTPQPQTATSKGPEPISTPQCDNALSAFRSGDLAAEHDENVDPTDDVDMEDVIIPPETRRSSRKPKPTKQPADMIHWRDANKRIKGLRMSA